MGAILKTGQRAPVSIRFEGGSKMDYNYNNYDRDYAYADSALQPNEYMARTYRWMASGLIVTFAMAIITAATPLLYVVDSLYLVLTIAELALVFALSARVQTMSVGGARAAFFGYALLNGMVMSYYFVLFDLGTLVVAFLSAAVYFGLMAVYGRSTERDLSAWGPRLMMALVALIVSGLVSMLFGGSFVGSVLYCGIGLVVFMLLTAYDSQKLQQLYSYYAFDREMAEKASIYGALTLYLDFINIFLYVVRLMGNRRRN
jgi:FtsH-binding integral membrane protein